MTADQMHLRKAAAELYTCPLRHMAHRQWKVHKTSKMFDIFVEFARRIGLMQTSKRATLYMYVKKKYIFRRGQVSFSSKFFLKMTDKAIFAEGNQFFGSTIFVPKL